MTPNEIAAQVFPYLAYPGFDFHLGGGGAERYWLQGSFMAPCSMSGAPSRQFTRKWYVSSEATKSEIVRTAFKLVMTAVEHEARERFTWRGAAVFGPHLDVDLLARLLDQGGALDERGP